MNIVVERPPRTIMEVYQMLPEGTLAELINGKIYMSPSPIKRHQKVIGKLFSQLYQHFENQNLGEVYMAPFDVYLDEHANAVQPDVIFVKQENLSIVKDHIHGVPDLVVEVLSGGNRGHDLKTKKDLYEKFQLKEYWVIDPDSNEAIIFIYENGAYKQLPTTHGSVSSPMLKHTFTF
ncbi:MAG: Uma2 family endonuclease [Cyclobacteriaceae bacterium]|jgi:Uma2 family endonuclease|nr:Uma2 family endonuclease [Flammeovirgaceae bacterium]